MSSPPSEPTDDPYEEHVQRVEDALASGQATNVLYTVDENRTLYVPERAAQHMEIIDLLLSAAASVPANRKAIISGGPSGAGKTTVLTTYAGIDPSQWLVLNPDDVKELMAARGMVPSIDGLAPMELASLIHEESSFITHKLAKAAYARGLNVIWDLTMSSENSTQKRMDDLREAGYGDVQGIFVDVPVDVSMRRAVSRHRAGLERWRAGKGSGGRYVRPEDIKSQAGDQLVTVQRRVFETLRDRFTSWEEWDNSEDHKRPRRTSKGPEK
jgi:hypothetical protein